MKRGRGGLNVSLVFPPPSPIGIERPARDHRPRGPPGRPTTEDAVFVACSTLCFGKYPLDKAFRIIAELEFSKVDVAIHQKGPHLRPSDVVKDVTGVAQKLRYGPGLMPAAFDVNIEAGS